MALVQNSFSKTGKTDLKLGVETGTSGQLTFTVEFGDYSTLLSTVTTKVNDAIAEYTTQVYAATAATLGATAGDPGNLSAVDGTYVVADAGSGTATFTVVIASGVPTVTLLSAGTGYTANDTVTLATVDTSGTTLGPTALTADITGSSSDAGVISAAAKAAALDAARRAHLDTLANSINDAADDAALKTALDGAAAIVTAATSTHTAATKFVAGTAAVTDANDIKDGKYRLAYSDAIGAVSYSSSNSVQVIQFEIKNGVMVGSHSLLSVTTNATFDTAGAITANPSKLTATLTGLTDGKGYGIQLTKLIDNGPLGPTTSIGAGTDAARAIVNGGPEALDANFRVILTKSTTAGGNHAKMEFKCATGETAEHTTGRFTDLKALRLMWSDAITCEFKTADFVIDGSSGSIPTYNGGNTIFTNVDHDFESPVETTLFEYSAALVDKADVVSEYVSTEFASSVADNATNVQDLLVSGDTALGTELIVRWKAPSFTAATILGYEVIYQKLTDTTADRASSTLANNTTGVIPFICAIDRGTTVTIPNADIDFKMTSAGGNGVAPGYSPDIMEKKLTGLTERAKYAVWVRAYHKDDLKGAIGLDKMAAPGQVYSSVQVPDGSGGQQDEGMIAFDASLHSWAGSYIETATSATYVSAAQDTAATTIALFTKHDSSKTGLMATLTGAPSDFNTAASAVSVVAGKNVQADLLVASDGQTAAIQPPATSAGDTLMNTSLAIKWEDRLLDFNGMTSGKAIQYLLFEKTQYDKLTSAELTALYAGTLVKKAQTTANDGTVTLDTFYNLDDSTDAALPHWTDMKTGALGDGVLTTASYGVLSKNSSTRYSRFAKDASAADGALATFNTNGSLATNGTEALNQPALINVTLDDGVLQDDTGITRVTNQALDLGKEYVFALRLKNDNGTSAVKTMDAKMVNGRASAQLYLKENASSDADMINSGSGTSQDGTSLTWDAANGRFVFKITDKHFGTDADDASDDAVLPGPTGAQTTGLAYEVELTSASQEDARNKATSLVGSVPIVGATPSHEISNAGDHSGTGLKRIPCQATTSNNVTTVTFDKVWAKAINYTPVTNANGAITNYNSTTATDYSQVSLSSLYGWKFGIKLYAKNTNGEAHSSGSEYTDARQVFAAESVFTGTATDAVKTKPADTVTNGVTTTYPDVTTMDVTNLATDQNATAGTVTGSGTSQIYVLSADIKDFTATEFDDVGRKVDQIKYKIFQTLADNNEHIVKSEEMVAPDARMYQYIDNNGDAQEAAKLNDGANIRYESLGYPLKYQRPIKTNNAGNFGTAASYTNNTNVPNRFTTWVPKSAAKMGYKLKMEITLVSQQAKDFAESPADLEEPLIESSKKYETTTKELIFDTIPTDDHDEVQHMIVTPGDGEMTISWSGPDMSATQFQPADATSFTPALEGYRIELYDLVTRSPEQKQDGTGPRSWDANSTAGTSSRLDAIAPTGDRVVTQTTLTPTTISHTITGLDNGKWYVPVIKTVTRQGNDVVTSVGRTCYGNIGSAINEVEMHSVPVKYTDGNEETAYTAIRWRKAAPQQTPADVGTDVTGTYFKTSGGDATVKVPFGKPIINVDLSSSPKTLKVDDNGSNLLFGAMLQTQPGGTNPMPDGTRPQRIGGAMSTSPGIDNVFYLDLSFGANAYGNASAASVTNQTFDADSVVSYESGNVTYPARDVTKVNTAYLGTNWALESNYIFASNASGTTVGKITGGAYSGL